jgi:hypothetical protein
MVGMGVDGGAAGAGGAEACLAPTDTVASKRIVRLSFHQIGTSIAALLGPEILRQVSLDVPGEIDEGGYRALPPLSNPREGSVYTELGWTAADRIAQRAARAVLDGFASVTRCGDAPTVECGRSFVLDFAQRAYRRALSAEESESLLTVYDETRGLLGNVPEAVQSSVHAVLVAPEFLYRTELGGDGNRAGELTPQELASVLAFFLTDAPPDQALLDAAAGGHLVSDADFAAQVTRLLATDGVRQNLDLVLQSYFSLPTLDNVVLDTEALGFVPSRASMKLEATRFLHDTLWDGTIAELLTSRRSLVDANLASIYGITFPPAGAQLDGDGFAPVEVPAVRSGLLTMPGFLAARARPSSTSIVGRGLTIRATILCATNPAFPTTIDPVPPINPDATAIQKAMIRMTTPGCRECHADIDPYGIALEHFDMIGRFRNNDEAGRPIDTSTVLPLLSGGVAVSDALSLARELGKGDRFTACLAQRVLAYSLMSSDGVTPATPESCAIRALVGALGAGPVHFSDLIRQIALSPAFRQRRAGGAP